MAVKRKAIRNTCGEWSKVHIAATVVFGRKPVFAFHEILGNHNAFFIIYSCRKVSGEVKLSREHTEFRWATKEQILGMKTENYLRAFFSGNFVE